MERSEILKGISYSFIITLHIFIFFIITLPLLMRAPCSGVAATAEQGTGTRRRMGYL